MFIKKVRIENIRSYVDETIEFPEGSVLLAGDIGCGKSTILLAVEFALFGIMKGETSGAHLLRHGSKDGSVTLNLIISGKDIIIKRALKRNSNGISQESGYIITNGVKTDFVSKELKARVLQLLGYSELLLNKSKSLIYRYTVYTPQEDMKRIILSTPEERLNTLRSVFGIDKYKTIKENISIYTRELKRKISYMQGQAQDLDEIKIKIYERIIQKEEIDKNIKSAAVDVEKISANSKIISDNLLKKEKEIEVIRQTKNNLKIIESKIENAKRNIKSYEERVISESERIKLIEAEIKDNRKVNEEKLLQKISEIKKESIDAKSRINEIIKLIAKDEYKKSESEKINQKISSLTKCIVCLQDVNDEHKHRIIHGNNEKIKETEKTLSELIKEKTILEKKCLELEQKRDEYEAIQKKAEIVKIKTRMLEEKKIEIENTQKIIYEQKLILSKLNEDKEKSEKEIKDTGAAEKDYIEARQEFMKIQAVLKNEEIKLARLSEQKSSVEEIIGELEKQVKVKEELKKTILRMTDVYNWLSDFFENVIITMEKHVFTKIYYEFNDLVAKWFSTLIGDETITLRLNNEFTPMLEQNGYETEIENLSGGEKTAVALSYRLALNKVINDVVSNVNTKDLIILDEPTDGFSSEQLDRVKEVLEELELKQVIIVSHESKVEGFVDKVIRIVKSEHESKVSS